MGGLYEERSKKGSSRRKVEGQGQPHREKREVKGLEHEEIAAVVDVQPHPYKRKMGYDSYAHHINS